MPANRPAISESGFRIVVADWQRDHTAIQAVRQDVFVREQGISAELEWDGRDADCTHVLALLADGHAVGTGRLQPDGRIGRMAVSRAWRNRGIGKALLVGLQCCAHRQGLARVYLHAQVDSEEFYRRAGFCRRGEPFHEAGIVHVEMVKSLD